ncbi:MAG: PKD-like domain-containing protein, partial [Bacteroidales bacterium]
TNTNNTGICSETAFNLSLAATVLCNFSWAIGTVTGGITGAIAGNGNLINQILSNPSNVLSGSVQYLITPISLPYNCQGDPFIITVTVNPLATVTASSSVYSVCPETNFNLFSSSSMSPPAVLLADNFNSATNTWSKTNTSTGGTTANAAWTLRPDGYVTNSVTFHSNDNSQFYISDSRLQNGTVTAVSLVSPVMSTLGYSSLSLSFWHYYDFNSTSGEFAKVEVSTNNGASWNTVATYTGDRGAANGFQNENIDLGAAYNNSTTFQVRFNYFCGSNRGRYWAIDNASVSGIPIVTPEISWTSNPEGFSSILANPTGISQVITTVYNVHYINPVTTCNSEASVSVSSLPVPEPNILADYCIVPGMIRLTASVGSTYLWNTGETTRIIEVDIAGVYSVVVTNVSGCSATAFFAVSVEKVVNGDFSAGNTGFTSGYVYDPAANGLIAPESEYAINSDAHYTHTNFWGYDHTSGSGTGNDNFLIVNGAKYAPQPFVWRETVSVQPNTNYYFSAWAKSLNNVLPFAELRFSVNGTQVGTTAFLTTGQNILNNPWLLKDRFYGMWNSGASTSAMIEILDLNTSANGNDFGLDDISFGTLAQIPFTIDPTSNKGNFCMGETLQLYANIDGGRPPISFQWTGPNGFTSLLTNPVVLNIPVAGGGKYY